MSEKAIQEGLQDIFQALAGYENADVVINDWGVLDGEIVKAPYVIIGNANIFTGRQDAQTANTRWDVEVYLFIGFPPGSTWKAVLDDFRDKRQTLLDTMNSSDNRSANGIESVTIDVVRQGAPVEYWYDPSTPPDMLASSTPLFVYQMMIFEAEEY